MTSRALLLRPLPLPLCQLASVQQALGHSISTGCHLTDDQASPALQLVGHHILAAYTAYYHRLIAMQHDFQKVAREFARRELLPYASEWDENKHFPVKTLRAAAQLGFGGLYIRYKYPHTSIPAFSG